MRRIKIESFALLIFLTLFPLNNSLSQKNFYIDKAGEQFIEGNIAKGISLLEIAIEKDSNDARAYYNLGNFNTAIGNFEKAIDYYLKASEIYPKYMESFSSLMGLYPKYYEAIDNLALVYLVTAKYDEAIRLSEESSMPGIDNEQPLRTYYLAHILKGDQLKGLEQFRKYKLLLKNTDKIKNDSLLVNAFIEKRLSETGFLSYLKSQLTEGAPIRALEYLQTALNEQPDNKAFLELKELYSDPDYDDKRTENLEIQNEYLKALSLSQNNYTEEAEDIIDELIENDPDNLSFLELQAAVKFQAIKHNEAIEISQKMLLLNPNAASIWYNLGNFYIRMDSLDQAESCFTKSLEINPEYPDANAFLGTIAWMRDSDYAKAKSFYDREIEVNPKNTDVYYNAGKLSFQYKDYEDAIKYLTQLISINPHDLMGRARLIQVYETIDDKQKAISLTNETLEFAIDQKKSKDEIEYFRKKKEELESK